MATSSSSLSKYQKLTDREHILKKPDTYIGSIENTEHEDYLFNESKIIMKNRYFCEKVVANCRIVPGKCPAKSRASTWGILTSGAKRDFLSSRPTAGNLTP